MGKVKYLNEIEKFINKCIVFEAKDIKRFLISKKANPSYAYTILHNMAKKKKINRIVKGYYSKHDDPFLAAYCIKPSYIGLESALSLHGLWEQETNVVLITPRRVRSGLRKVLNANVVVHYSDKKFFFGYEYTDYYDLKLPVSDLEKTFIDLAFYNKFLDKNLLKAFRKKIDYKKLKQYLNSYDKRFANRALALLGERAAS